MPLFLSRARLCDALSSSGGALVRFEVVIQFLVAQSSGKGASASFRSAFFSFF